MIGGVLLAAGRSQRMGRPKLVLPWKDGRPIIVHMVDLFIKAQVNPLVVVTGAARREIETCLAGHPVVLRYNQKHAQQGMIGSVYVGLRALRESGCEAALITPADLPGLRLETLRCLMDAYHKKNAAIVAPSFERRRGHPVLISAEVWDAIFDLPPGQSLRDFLRNRSGSIHHVVVDDPGILTDLDTPEDYKSRLEANG